MPVREEARSDAVEANSAASELVGVPGERAAGGLDQGGSSRLVEPHDVAVMIQQAVNDVPTTADERGDGPPPPPQR